MEKAHRLVLQTSRQQTVAPLPELGQVLVRGKIIQRYRSRQMYEMKAGLDIVSLDMQTELPDALREIRGIKLSAVVETV